MFFMIADVAAHVHTLLVSCSEYPRDKPFVLTMVSYIKNKLKFKNKNKREKKSNEPFQSYLLTGQADSAKKAG